MENSYGIGIQNRYELFFDEDADPFDLIKRPVVPKDPTDEKENKDKTSKSKTSAIKKSIKTETVQKTTEKSVTQGESSSTKFAIVEFVSYLTRARTYLDPAIGTWCFKCVVVHLSSL